LQSRDLRYWRDKRGHEVYLVLARRGKPPVAIECQWSASHVDVSNLRAFRRAYPRGENFLVAHDVGRAFVRHDGALEVHVTSLPMLIEHLL